MLLSTNSIVEAFDESTGENVPEDNVAVVAGAEEEARIAGMRLDHEYLAGVVLELVHELGVVRVPHLDDKVALGGDDERVVAVPRDHGHGELLVYVVGGELVVGIDLEQRLAAVDENGAPILILVLPDARRAVLAAAEEAGRVVGVLDAVDEVVVRLELAYLDRIAVVEEVDANGVVVAASGQERAACTERQAQDLSARSRLLDEFLRFRSAKVFVFISHFTFRI